MTMKHNDRLCALCASVRTEFSVTMTLSLLSSLTVVTRDVVSVSDVSSRDGLETYQRLVSVSSRANWRKSRSRLGLEVERLGLGP
jgi:hypothetical protein